jgi:hypothetical protein
MARKKQPEPDDKEQYRRFVKAAKEHFGEDAEEKFEEAMKKILRKEETKSGQDTDKQEAPP